MHALGNLGNKYYQDSKPWELVKDRPGGGGVGHGDLRQPGQGDRRVPQARLSLRSAAASSGSSARNSRGATTVFSLSGKPLVVTEKLVIPLTDEDIAPLFGPPPQGAAQPVVQGPNDGLIDIAAFKAVDLRVAKIVAAERIEKSKKLLKLQCRDRRRKAADTRRDRRALRARGACRKKCCRNSKPAARETHGS